VVKRGWATALFGALLLLYLANGEVLPGNDTKANVYLPVSLLHDGDLAFSPLEAPFMFRWEVESGAGRKALFFGAWSDADPVSGASAAQLYRAGKIHFAGYAREYLVPSRRVRPQSGEPLFANTFGPGPGIVALPVALAGALLFDIDLRGDHRALWMLAKLTAALLVAASAAFVYLAAAGFTTRARAALLALAYGTGTCVWSVSSQALWQQTPVIFFLSLGALCIVRGERAWIRGAVAGLALSMAVVCRPTAVFVLAAAAGHLLVVERRALLGFSIAALPLLAALAYYNFHYFGSPWSFGQLASGEIVAALKTGSPATWQTPLWLGAAGLLLSPSRGLLVYSPFLLAALAGAWFAWRRTEFLRLRFLTLAAAGLWLPAFLWFDWWGGWSYGYRPIVDSAPLVVLLCLPVLDWILDRGALRAAFAVAIGWSVLVQAVGAFAYSPPAWNARVIDPSGRQANIDLPEYRHRLWSFRDWQIAYFLARFPQAAAERRAFAAAWVSRPYN
jgi:hypothetical protein